MAVFKPYRIPHAASLSLALLVFLFLIFFRSHAFRPQQPSSALTLLVVANLSDHHSHKTQYRALECYANRHGYLTSYLDPSTTPCDNAAHEMPCAVAYWLTNNPQIPSVVPLPTDVIPGAPEMPLTRWQIADVTLYERADYTLSDIPLIRNTPFGRALLEVWGETQHSRAVALSIVLMKALGIKGRRGCEKSLPQMGGFLACANGLIGPARMHIVHASGGRPVGSVAVFPRFFGFSVRARVHGFSGYRNLHVFHEDVGDEEWERRYIDYEDGGRVDKCATYSRNESVSDGYLAVRLREADEYAMKYPSDELAQVPRFGPGDKNCYDRIWCAPLRRGAALHDGVVSRNGKMVRFTTGRTEVDRENEFAEQVLSGRRGGRDDELLKLMDQP